MYITAYRCHVFFTISNVYIQAVLSVILTFVPPHHILKYNKHGNVDISPPINIYFLIVGLENKYFFGKSEHPWAHELTSQTGGELTSWSPSVSAALKQTIFFLGLTKHAFTWMISSKMNDFIILRQAPGPWSINGLNKIIHCAYLSW